MRRTETTTSHKTPHTRHKSHTLVNVNKEKKKKSAHTSADSLRVQMLRQVLLANRGILR